jgi:hypothetical protein
MKNGLVVTETGAGRVLTVNPDTGQVKVAVDGLAPYSAAGAAKIGRWFAIVTGEADPSAPAGPFPGSSVLIAKRHGTPTVLADLLAHELENNPDGQTQFGEDGAPLDALSNPFSVIRAKGNHGFVLVADGGANDVLAVDRQGNVETFFVPPTVNTGACEGLPNNDENTVGCDAVPTGLAYGPDGLYISALTAEVPGEGRVYVVDPKTGDLVRTITGFTAPTGVAVDKRDGTLYVSELLEGAPAGEPGPDFDPSSIGQIVKVTPNGTRKAAQVTMPIGLVLDGSTLYSTAWSVAGLFLGAEGLGQVVSVPKKMFTQLTGDPARRPSGRAFSLRQFH